MGFFRRQEQVEPAQAAAPKWGAGRRLSSSHDAVACAQLVSALLEVHAPTPYAQMPTLHPSNVEWHGADPVEAPTAAYTFHFADDIFGLALWPQAGGTHLGLFPLGGSDDALQTPLIGLWKQSDPSLSSIGMLAAGQLALLPPSIGVDYYADLLRLGGKVVDPENALILANQVAMMVGVKAAGFISQVANDPRRADAFIDDHGWDGDPLLPERMLRDLAAWNGQVIPYIQDLPWRIQGILLGSGAPGEPRANVWSRLR